MTDFSNGLSADQLERLAMLSEELGEALQSVGKIIRHGYDSHHPNGGESNRKALLRELTDVFLVTKLLDLSGDVSFDDYGSGRLKRKILSFRAYCHHQPAELITRLETEL